MRLPAIPFTPPMYRTAGVRVWYRINGEDHADTIRSKARASMALLSELVRKREPSEPVPTEDEIARSKEAAFRLAVEALTGAVDCVETPDGAKQMAPQEFGDAALDYWRTASPRFMSEVLVGIFNEEVDVAQLGKS